MKEQPLLQMMGICKSFEGTAVLKQVNIELARGEVVALMGENGAGKSTLMKILSGIHLPDEGSILLRGEKQLISSVRVAASLGIVLIHQELNLCENLTVAENIFLGREPRNSFGLIRRSQLIADAQSILSNYGISIPVNALVGDLPIAQRQMVEIAKALSQRIDILIMDEPSSSLSHRETELLFKVIRDLKTNGVTVVYISHRLQEIETIADRAIVMRDGRYIGSLQRAAFNRSRFFSMMVGRDMPASLVRKSTTATAPVKLALEGIRSYRYADKAIDLTLREAEILGIAGLAGAGRSELLHTLFGIHPAKGGKILLQGKQVAIRNPRDAMKAGMVLIPEDRRQQGLFMDWNLPENLAITQLTNYTRKGLLSSDLLEQKALPLIARLKVRYPSLKSAVKFLSGGNQQKLAIGKWLPIQAPIYLFDEPTRGVDMGAKEEIYNIIRALQAQGIAIIVVSSDIEELLQLADRVLVMCEGAINGELTGENITEEAIIRYAVHA